MTKISLKQLQEKATAVSSIVKDVTCCRIPNDEELDDLERNYDELYSMILDIIETFDCVLSNVGK